MSDNTISVHTKKTCCFSEKLGKDETTSMKNMQWHNLRRMSVMPFTRTFNQIYKQKCIQVHNQKIQKPVQIT